MIGVNNILVEFEGKWSFNPVTKRYGLFKDTSAVGKLKLEIDPMFDPMEHLITVGKIVSVPNNLGGGFPHNLKVGDRVRTVYNCIDPDSEQPMLMNGDRGIFRVAPDEILYKMNQDEPIEMQFGWLAIEPIPLKVPVGTVIKKYGHTLYFVDSKTDVVKSKVDTTETQGQSIVRIVGPNVEGMEEVFPGDHIYMERHCEFTNGGRNKIGDKRYWFVRQEDVLMKVLNSEFK
jgi:hypothetical protein